MNTFYVLKRTKAQSRHGGGIRLKECTKRPLSIKQQIKGVDGNSTEKESILIVLSQMVMFEGGGEVVECG